MHQRFPEEQVNVFFILTALCRMGKPPAWKSASAQGGASMEVLPSEVASLREKDSRKGEYRQNEDEGAWFFARVQIAQHGDDRPVVCCAVFSHGRRDGTGGGQSPGGADRIFL